MGYRVMVTVASGVCMYTVCIQSAADFREHCIEYSVNINCWKPFNDLGQNLLRILWKFYHWFLVFKKKKKNSSSGYQDMENFRFVELFDTVNLFFIQCL